MVNSSVILCAIVLVVSLSEINSVSVYKTNSYSAVKANNTNYETAGWQPVIQRQGSDETSQEEEDAADDENDTADDSAEESTEYEEDRNCSCSGSKCVCCINMNLSFIDLGGPGCVKFGYVSQNDSLNVNISYGERLLESNIVKRDSPKPACMDLFSDLAQMCAKFSGLTKVARGVKGCVTVEPILLGVSQSNYDVGCFNMDIEGVQPQVAHITHQSTSGSNSTKETTDKPEENEEEEEELAAAISQSAEEGFAWFNNFISSVFGEELNDTSSEPTPSVSPNSKIHNQTKLPTAG